MKKILILLLVCTTTLAMFSCRKKGELPPEMKMSAELIKDTTQILFIDSPTYHFDTINEGDKVEHTFRIKNVGEKNFIIAYAAGSCGCTVPDYPKNPVKPGEIASIFVTFNSAGKQNEQNKSVTLTCNTEKHSEMLFLTGFVRPKK
jgi:hypothetical protein